ncbi:hypothetical protein GQ54DRAFT_312831 [Martensiomyces pterosporus]|nr:hypothetical protein GQ54DRAFT_312831 [Martensiomyces pterosporus]
MRVSFVKAAIGLCALSLVHAKISDQEYQAIKSTLSQEMSNHHTFTTEGLFHDLAASLGLTSALPDLYVGSPTASRGYEAIYNKLCQLYTDPDNTPEQTTTIGRLRDFVRTLY